MPGHRDVTQGIFSPLIHYWYSHPAWKIEPDSLASSNPRRPAPNLFSHAQATFDSEHGGTWNCIVGESFGASISHEDSQLVFFAIKGREPEPPLYCLLYRPMNITTDDRGGGGGGTIAESSDMASISSSNTSYSVIAADEDSAMSQIPTPSAEIFSDTEEGDDLPKEKSAEQPMRTTSAQYAQAYDEHDERQPPMSRSARRGKEKCGRC